MDEIETPAPAPDPDGASVQGTGAAVRKQLLLLGVFVVFALLLFALAGTVLATGGGCGGG